MVFKVLVGIDKSIFAVFPNSFHETSITPIPKSDKDITRKKLSGQYSDVHRCKNPPKISTHQIQHHIERIIYLDQIRFIYGMQRWFNICDSINVTHHINEMKDKNYVSISIDEEKAYHKI